MTLTVYVHTDLKPGYACYYAGALTNLATEPDITTRGTAECWKYVPDLVIFVERYWNVSVKIEIIHISNADLTRERPFLSAQMRWDL